MKYYHGFLFAGDLTVMVKNTEAEMKDYMRKLVDELNEASDVYYNGKGEILSDYEWDAKFDELKSLEDTSGIVLDDSPTQNVSKDDVEGKKEKHEYPALSLAKTKSIKDFVKWAAGKDVWLSVKLDGATLVATYDNGRLSKLLTRGNGAVGTNITHLASAIHGIPLKIQDMGHMVVRGEAVLTYADFEAFNAVAEESYANPRNLVAGSLNLKKVSDVKPRNIRWVAFTLVYTDNDIVSWGDRMSYLSDLGFETVYSIKCSTFDENAVDSLEKGVQKLTSMIESGNYQYPADGLVESYDDTEYAKGGSITGHHATRAGFALKWKDESVISTLDHIEWSCAAQAITPVAVFKPVSLEGTVVKRASLANISECERLGIGDKGSEIEVIKANKIIPKVIHVEKKVGQLVLPDVCPVCGEKTEVKVSSSGAKTLHCTNVKCAAKQLSKFTRFVSKDGMNIEGLSTSNIEKFVNNGWIRCYADFYDLEKYFDELKEMDGFGEKSVLNLKVSIDKSRNIDAKNLLYALCIPMVGHDVIKKLLKEYSFSNLLEDVLKASERQDFGRYSFINGIGPEKSEAFVRWFCDEDNLESLNNLLVKVDIRENIVSNVGGKCDGLTFVITGDVYQFKNRKELQIYIEANGGKATGSVTGKTSYLINNDISSMSGKNRKAKELGVPIISEEEFLTMFS